MNFSAQILSLHNVPGGSLTVLGKRSLLLYCQGAKIHCRAKETVASLALKITTHLNSGGAPLVSSTPAGGKQSKHIRSRGLPPSSSKLDEGSSNLCWTGHTSGQWTALHQGVQAQRTDGVLGLAAEPERECRDCIDEGRGAHP